MNDLKVKIFNPPLLNPPKRWRSAKVCPKCGSRATKILSASRGMYHCQICEHNYSPPEVKIKVIKNG